MSDQDIVLKVLSPLSKCIDDVTHGLSELINSVIPEILKVQETAQSIDYNNMLIAATFFSAVTVTTLQLSYAYNTNPHASFGVAVNTLWFVALVFSTASSLGSLVGLTWYQKIRRVRLLPDWARLYLEDGPTISLVIASTAFSTGLCLFAFSSSQHIITSTLTAVFTAAHAVALFVSLCLYSPNRLSRSLLKVFSMSFSYCKEVYIRHWYLYRVPRRDRDLVVHIMRLSGAPWSKANIIAIQRDIEAERTSESMSELQTMPSAATSSTGDASPELGSSPTGVKRNIKLAWMFVRQSLHTVFSQHILHWPNWLALRQRRTCTATKDPGDLEQAYESDERVAIPYKLEYDIETQEDAGKPGMQKPTITEDQGSALSEEPRTLTHGSTDPREYADLTERGPGENVGRSFGTSPAQGSMKEPTAAISSMADSIPGASSSPMVQNSDKGLKNVERLRETDARGRPNQLREEEQGSPSCSFVQEGEESRRAGASN
ncbi:hypothetical protein M0805_001957 [Coniferiporia weirii]|nr:hypothetical protein M0805_001957 [Coniferiporia weirii]